MDFEELKLPHGTSLQLQMNNSAGQPERYASRFVGALPGRSLIVSVPRASGKLVRFRPGQRMAVRTMIANGIGLFGAVVEAQSTEPFPLLYLSYPETVKFKGIRNAIRVVVEQPLQLTNLNSLEEGTTEGYIADISVSGARLELREAVAAIGDTVRLTTQIAVQGLSFDCDIEAIVRSRVERSTQEDNQELPAVYGVEFTERDKQTLLTLYAYVFSQIVEDYTPKDSE